MNRRQILKAIFVAPIAALLGTKIVSESKLISNTNLAAEYEPKSFSLGVRIPADMAHELEAMKRDEIALMLERNRMFIEANRRAIRWIESRGAE